MQDMFLDIWQQCSARDNLCLGFLDFHGAVIELFSYTYLYIHISIYFDKNTHTHTHTRTHAHTHTHKFMLPQELNFVFSVKA